MQSVDSEMVRELEHAATHAELARPLVHECNNFLNTLLLQIALLEADSIEGLQANLAALRRDGRGLAALLQEWQRFRKPPRVGNVDLNQQVRQALHDLQAEWGGSALPISLALGSGPLVMSLSAIELKRLIHMLLVLAMGKSRDTRNPAWVLEISTDRNEDTTELAIRDSEGAAEWLTALGEAKPRNELLISSACRTLVSRLQAKLFVEKVSDGSGSVMIRWARAA